MWIVEGDDRMDSRRYINNVIGPRAFPLYCDVYEAEGIAIRQNDGAGYHT